MQWTNRRYWAGFAALSVLSACGMVDGKADSRPTLSAPIAPVSTSVASDVPVKIGAPYKVGNVTYEPVDDPSYDETGYASWYGAERAGHDTANGEPFVPGAITAAHRTLPLPSYVEVTALDTGRTILVRVNDRGPFTGGKLIDLSRGAAEQLGIVSAGKAAVRVRRVNPSEPEKGLLRSGVRAPARMDMPEAVLVELRKRLPGQAEAPPPPAPKLAAAPPTAKPDMPKPSAPPKAPQPAPVASKPPAPISVKQAPVAAKPMAKPVMVQVGAYSSKQRAEDIAKKLDGAVTPSGKLWRVRVGPFADRAAGQHSVDKAAASGFPGARIVVND